MLVSPSGQDSLQSQSRIRVMDYSGLASLIRGGNYTHVVGVLRQELRSLWLAEYAAMCRHVPNVLQFEIDGFGHLFDYTSDPAVASATTQADDRLVVVFGLS